MRSNQARVVLTVLLLAILACGGPGGSPTLNPENNEFGQATAQLASPTPKPPELGLDFGDAPDPTFPSLLASNGARTGVGDYWLGGPPTTEADAKITDNDDDDGLVEMLVTAGGVRLTFQAALSEAARPTDAYFNLLADANGDGRWAAFTGPAGAVNEWAEQNRKVSLTPGGVVSIATQFPLVEGNLQAWFRATLTDQPVVRASVDWDGSGAFTCCEVEDYVVRPAPREDWDVKCEPDTLIMKHGDLDKTIRLVVAAGAGGPSNFRVVEVGGPIGGLFPDPDGAEIDVTQDPAPGANGWSAFAPPGPALSVASLAVHGPPHFKDYTIEVRLASAGRVETEKCFVSVEHDYEEPGLTPQGPTEGPPTDGPPTLVPPTIPPPTEKTKPTLSGSREFKCGETWAYTGSGFTPNGRVDKVFTLPDGTQVTAQTTAGPGGEFAGTFTTDCARAGSMTLLATDRATSQQAQTTVNVLP